MPRCLAIRVLLLCFVGMAIPFGSLCGPWAQAVEADERADFGLQESIAGAAPQKAYDLLAKLKQRGGEPLPGYIGGRDFHNRERQLPRGRYRKYDVNRKIPGQGRDGERLVIEQNTGKAYYTGDHYRSFIPLN